MTFIEGSDKPGKDALKKLVEDVFSLPAEQRTAENLTEVLKKNKLATGEQMDGAKDVGDSLKKNSSQ